MANSAPDENAFVKRLRDGTTYNSAIAHPAKGAIAKQLPVMTIDNDTLHLVGLRRSRGASQSTHFF